MLCEDVRDDFPYVLGLIDCLHNWRPEEGSPTQQAGLADAVAKVGHSFKATSGDGSDGEPILRVTPHGRPLPAPLSKDVFESSEAGSVQLAKEDCAVFQCAARFLG